MSEVKQYHECIVEKIESQTTTLCRHLDGRRSQGLSKDQEVESGPAIVAAREAKYGRAAVRGKGELRSGKTELQMEKAIRRQASCADSHSQTPAKGIATATPEGNTSRSNTSLRRALPEVQRTEPYENTKLVAAVGIKLRPVPLIGVTDPRPRKWMAEKDTRQDNAKGRAC